MPAARFYVGQNIATSWTYPRPNALGATPEFAKQITNWFNEVRSYHFRSTSSGTGHYSQVGTRCQRIAYWQTHCPDTSV